VSVFDDDDFFEELTGGAPPAPKPRRIAGGFKTSDEVDAIVNAVGHPPLRVTPVGENKMPLEKGWNMEDYFSGWSMDTSTRLRQWFQTYGNPNFAFILGVNCGPGGAVVLEADNEAGEKWLQEHCPETPIMTLTRHGFRHRYYAGLSGPDGMVVPPIKIDILRSKRKWKQTAIENGYNVTADKPDLDDNEKDRLRQEIERAMRDIPMGPVIDLKSAGSQIMVPGSLHPTGYQYKMVTPWTADLWAVRPVFSQKWFPDEVWEQPKATEFAASIGVGANYDKVYWTPEKRIAAALKYADRRPGAISGQDGHNHTMRTATLLIRGFDLDRPSAQVVMDHWNESCQPPWEPKDLSHKIDEAFKGRGRGSEPMGFKLTGKKRTGVAGRMDQLIEDMEREAAQKAISAPTSTKPDITPTIEFNMDFDGDPDDFPAKPETSTSLALVHSDPSIKPTPIIEPPLSVVPPEPEIIEGPPAVEVENAPASQSAFEPGEDWIEMEGPDVVSTGHLKKPEKPKHVKVFTQDKQVNPEIAVKELLSAFGLDEDECKKDGVHLMIDYPDKAPPRLPPAPVNVYAVLKYSKIFRGRLTMNLMSLQRLLDGEEINEAMIARMRYRVDWLFHKPIARETFEEALTTVCSENGIDPLLEELFSLPPWDGVERLKNVAADILGVTDNLKEASLFVERWFLSLVARITRPGCKCDTALILKGGQGAFKSTFFREVIGDRFFTDQPMDLGDKDSRILLANHAIVEWSELEHVVSPKKVQLVKNFLSQREDKIRLPYGRSMVTLKRRCVIAGSTNETEILHDDTGDRRFWIVEVASRIAIDILRAQREQLLAEAKHRILEHFDSSDNGRRDAAWENGRFWFTLEENSRLVEKVNRDYRPTEVWAGDIALWISKQPGDDAFIASDVMAGIGLTIDRRDTGNERRVTRALRELNCEMVNAGKPTTLGGRRGRFWRKPKSMTGAPSISNAQQDLVMDFDEKMLS
jgi:hypothetical protein